MTCHVTCMEGSARPSVNNTKNFSAQIRWSHNSCLSQNQPFSGLDFVPHKKDKWYLSVWWWCCMCCSMDTACLYFASLNIYSYLERNWASSVQHFSHYWSLLSLCMWLTILTVAMAHSSTVDYIILKESNTTAMRHSSELTKIFGKCVKNVATPYRYWYRGSDHNILAQLVWPCLLYST